MDGATRLRRLGSEVQQSERCGRSEFRGLTRVRRAAPRRQGFLGSNLSAAPFMQ
jgi:hypothetical protein